MGGRHSGLKVFAPACFEQYVSVLQDPAAVHAMCEDYRASATIDMDQAKEDIEHGRAIENPLMVLWGEHGVIQSLFDAISEWKDVSHAEVVGRAVDCGHYIPEEASDVVVESIKGFFI